MDNDNIIDGWIPKERIEHFRKDANAKGVEIFFGHETVKNVSVHWVARIKSFQTAFEIGVICKKWITVYESDCEKRIKKANGN